MDITKEDEEEARKFAEMLVNRFLTVQKNELITSLQYIILESDMRKKELELLRQDERQCKPYSALEGSSDAIDHEHIQSTVFRLQKELPPEQGCGLNEIWLAYLQQRTTIKTLEQSHAAPSA